MPTALGNCYVTSDSKHGNGSNAQRTSPKPLVEKPKLGNRTKAKLKQPKRSRVLRVWGGLLDFWYLSLQNLDGPTKITEPKKQSQRCLLLTVPNIGYFQGSCFSRLLTQAYHTIILLRPYNKCSGNHSSFYSFGLQRDSSYVGYAFESLLLPSIGLLIRSLIQVTAPRFGHIVTNRAFLY